MTLALSHVRHSDYSDGILINFTNQQLSHHFLTISDLIEVDNSFKKKSNCRIKDIKCPTNCMYPNEIEKVTKHDVDRFDF